MTETAKTVENTQQAGIDEKKQISRDEVAAMLPGVQGDTLDALYSVMKVYTAAKGTQLLTEGEVTGSLYFIRKGHVEIFREAQDGKDEKHLSDLYDGMFLGEIALLDGKARSASARLHTDSQLIEFDPEDILHLPNGQAVMGDLRGCLAVAVTGRMRTQNDKYIAAMEREMAAIKERQLFGQFFLYTMGVMAIGMIVNDVLANQFLQVNIYTQTFAWQYLMIILVPSFFVIRKMGIPLKELGLTMIGFKKSFWEGLVVSAVVVAAAFGLAWVLKQLDIKAGTPVPAELGPTLSYLFHSLLQEMIARGFLQSSFQRFLDDKGGMRSVVLASLLFGVFHLHFGVMAVVMTAVTGIMFGALYLRHRNLVGPTLVHFFVGGAAFWSGLI